MIELPPLPAPQKECWIGHELFSADQMREYALAAVAAERERRKPLTYKQIRSVLLNVTALAGFKTIEPGDPSSLMVDVVRETERAHGIE